MTRISSSTSAMHLPAYTAKRMAERQVEQQAQSKPIKSAQQPRPIPTMDTGKANQETPVNLYSPAGKPTNRL